MTSKWTNVQGVLLIVTLASAIFLGDGRITLFSVAVGGAVVAIFLLLNHSYVRRLNGRPRSRRRASEDRTVAQGIVAVALATLAAAGLSLGARQVLSVAGIESVVSWGSIAGFAVAIIVAGFASLYLSSLVDRFVITPWTRGSLGILPFEDNRRNREDMTRLWLWHRIVCTAVFFAGFWAMCGLGYFGAVQSANGSNWALYLLGLFSPSIIPAIVMQGWLAGLPAAVNLGFGHIDICVGDYVQRKRGGAVLSGVIVEASVDKALTVVAPDGDVWILPLKEARPNDDVHRSAPPADVDWRSAVLQADIDLDDFTTPKEVPAGRWFAW